MRRSRPAAARPPVARHVTADCQVQGSGHQLARTLSRARTVTRERKLRGEPPGGSRASRVSYEARRWADREPNLSSSRQSRDLSPLASRNIASLEDGLHLRRHNRSRQHWLLCHRVCDPCRTRQPRARISILCQSRCASGDRERGRSHAQGSSSSTFDRIIDAVETIRLRLVCHRLCTCRGAGHRRPCGRRGHARAPQPKREWCMWHAHLFGAQSLGTWRRTWRSAPSTACRRGG